MPLIDLTHTSHARARTGIQRVVRGLWRHWPGGAAAVCFDPYQRAWRGLEAWERSGLEEGPAGGSRRARWPWRARWRGRWRRVAGHRTRLASADGVVVPEVFSPGVAAALPELFARSAGPCAALFHDAIALRLPETAPPATVARFPAYLKELLAFDGIAAISEDSRASLAEYWRAIGVTGAPPVAAIPLGIEVPARAAEPAQAPAGGAPVVLSVGSIEGRKNHLALLEACERLWGRGARFQLRLVGLARPETARPALERIAALQAAGRSLRYDGPADEAELESAYREAAFTVYPSLLEGFGLPVLESLVRGKPCVCSGRGALGESARGGGCLALDRVGTGDLEAAVGRLLGNSALLAGLAAEARARVFRTAADHARDVASWMAGLGKKPGPPRVGTAPA